MNIKFNKIANCFNSNDLWLFIDERNEHFKRFLIKEERNEDLNFLKIDSITSSKSKSLYTNFKQKEKNTSKIVL